ncbi:TniQ family protein [Acidovorax sp. BLS4]|uniref:TniQ family protein n=1 Tax=Acidovorax sp. BLS4 TaxID=3273430 RepID=UPI00294244E8|nr:TniQ family protein [Paracidovorax avenae]WOI46514.1 TniQ family protein [Paracidovorax avenae]
MSASDELKLWPNHFKPLPGELLSSWLIRLAHAHGYKVEQLCRLLLGPFQPMWNRDIDRCLTPQLRDALRAVTAATDDQLSAATLNSYAGYISGNVNSNGLSMWITSLAVYHRTRKLPGLACCPICLASGPEPYYRRIWRLSFVTVCVKHQVELINICPRCDSPFNPHRVDVGSQGYAPRRGLLARCAACGFDLRHHVPNKAAKDLVNWTDLLAGAAERGYLAWHGNADLHSVLFFNGIQPVTEALVSKVVGVRGGIDTAPLRARREAMEKLRELLVSSPAEICGITKYYGLTYTDCIRKKESPPSWLLKHFSDLKLRQNRRQTPEEFATIARILGAKVGRVSPTMAKLYFGIDATRKLPSYFYSSVSDNAFEQLMVSLDHLISETSDQPGRLALLQDKLAYSLVRIMGLTAPRLADITLDEAAQLLPRRNFLRHPGFRPVPTTSEELRDHLWWHIRKIRPTIVGAENTPRLFVSCYTGRPMKVTVFGTRFTRALKRTRLESLIADLGALRRRPSD